MLNFLNLRKFVEDNFEFDDNDENFPRRVENLWEKEKLIEFFLQVCCMRMCCKGLSCLYVLLCKRHPTIYGQSMTIERFVMNVENVQMKPLLSQCFF